MEGSNINLGVFIKQLGFLSVCLAVALFAMPALAQNEHSVGVGKSCPTATKVGDIATCRLTVVNTDDFGDVLFVDEIWDEVSAPVPFRVPEEGNLPILAVSEGVTCEPAPVDEETAPIGLVLPCVVPGLAEEGGSGLGILVRSRYTIPAGATDPLIDQGNVIVRDGCDMEPIGCSPLPQQQQFGAAVSLFVPSLLATQTGPDQAKVGDEITYTIGFTDTTTGTGFPGFENCTGSDTLLGDLGDFTAGVSRDFSYTVQPGDPNPLTNLATITCGVVDFDNIVENSAEHSVDLIGPAIEVTKDGPAVAKVGDEITYTIGFTVLSNGDLLGECTGSDTVLGDLGVFVSGQTRDFLYTVQGGDADPLPNTATITCAVEGFDNEVSESDDHSVDLIAPAIDVTKDGPAVAKVGDEITYTIGFTAIADGGFLGECTGSDTVLGDLGVFVSGQTRDFLYVVQGDDPDPLPNTATITCAVEGFDNTASDNADHSVDLVTPSVSLAKACAPDPVAVGNTINWTITIDNTGDIELDCLVNDPTAGLTDAPVTVAAGGTATLNASRIVNVSDAPTISNTATVSCPIDGLDNEIADEATATCEVRDISIPTLSDWSRWLMVLMILGVGLLLMKRGMVRTHNKL